MYKLVYYHQGIEVKTFELPATTYEVKTIGTSGGCHYIVREDNNLQSVHLMLRFNGELFELCPAITCKIKGQTLPPSSWTPIFFEQHFDLTSDSSFVITGGVNPNEFKLDFAAPVKKSDKQKAKAMENTSFIEQGSGTFEVIPQETPTMTPPVFHDTSFFTKEKEPSKPKPKKQKSPAEKSTVDASLKKSELFLEDEENLEILLSEVDDLVIEEDELEDEHFETQKKKKREKKKKTIILESEITGRLIGTRYKITNKIGAGAMGEVYEAWDKELQRRVALKILNHSNTESISGKRFILEAKAVAKIKHQNIVGVHDVGTFEDRPFFTMDLLDGVDLQEKMEMEDVSPREALEWIQSIAQAVQVAHEANIIHRDIKPSNIIITKEGPILTDFGIAKDITTEAQLTMEGQTLGTPTYMAPEQARGDIKNINQTSDVYSLGAVLYELLTKKPPFEGTPVDVLQKVCIQDPISIRKLNPDVHYDVVVIAIKAMAKEQKYRYKNAKEMADDIERYLDGVPIKGTPPPFYSRLGRIIKQNKAVSISIFLAFFLIISLLIWKISDDSKRAHEKRKKIERMLLQASKISEDAELRTLRKYKHLQKIESLNSLSYIDLNSGQLNKLADLYSKVLILSPKNKTAIEGRMKVILIMASKALIRKNINFASALFYITKQIAQNNNIEENRIKTGQLKIKQLKKEEERKCYKEVKKIFDTLKEDDSKDAIKNAAFALIRFYENFSKIASKYRFAINTNNKIRKAFFKAKRYISKKKHNGKLTEEENLMIRLLRYGENKLLLDMLKEGINKNREVAIFSIRLLGLLRNWKSMLIVSKKMEEENDPELIKTAIASILSFEQGEKLLLDKMKKKKLSIKKLSYGKYLVIPIIIDLIRKKQIENKKKVVKIFLQMGKKTFKKFLKVLEKLDIKERIEYINYIKDIKNDQVFEFLYKNSKSYNKTLKIISLKALKNNYINRDKVRTLLFYAANSIDPEIKIIGIQFLGLIGDKSQFSKLISYLDSDNADIRQAAIDALGKMGKSFSSVLFRHYKKEYGEKKLMLLEILANLGETHIIPALIKNLSSKNKNKVRVSVKMLPLYGASTLKTLYSIYKNRKTNTQMKINILKITSHIKHPKIGKFYMKGLKDPDPEVAKVASDCLYKLGDEATPFLIKILNSQRSRGVKTAIRILAYKIGKKVIPKLLESYKKADKKGRNNIIETLLGIGKPSIPYIIELSKAPSYEIRAHIAGIMGKFRNKQVIPRLIELLFDHERRVREKAQRSVAYMGKMCIPAIIEKYHALKKHEKKAMLIGVMGEIKDKRVLPILLPLLEDAKLKRKAASALRYFKDAIIRDLVKLMKYPSYHEGVHLTIRYIGRNYAFQPLKEILLDSKNPDRKIIPSLLANFRDAKTISKLIELSNDRKVGNLIWNAIGTMGKKVLRHIEKYYYEKNTKKFVLDILKKYPYESVPYLIRIVRKEKSYKNVEKFFKTMKGSARNRAARQIISLLRSPYAAVRKKSIQLLVRFRYRGALSSINRLLNDKNSGVRSLAKKAIDSLSK